MDLPVEEPVYNAYKPAAFDGVRVRSLLYAMWSSWAYSEDMVAHMQEMQLDSNYMRRAELDALGNTLAIPRPYDTSQQQEGAFLFDTLTETDPREPVERPEGYRKEHGFSSIPSRLGGFLSDASSVESVRGVSNAIYVQYIKDMVQLRKARGLLSICQVVSDLIAAVIDLDDAISTEDIANITNAYYKVEFKSNNANDIRITIDSICSRFKSTLQAAFDQTFTECPRVEILVDNIHVGS